MKLTKTLILVAAIVLQSAESLYAADGWADALLLFGGGTDIMLAAQNVFAGKGSMVPTAALDRAQESKSPEAMAIANFLSSSSQQYKQQKLAFFKNNQYKDNDVVTAINAIIADAQSRAVVSQPTTPVNQPTTPSNTNSGWTGWFGGSSSATTPSTITAADVDRAVAAQQKSDLVIAAQSNSMLASILSSGKTGLSLYTAFIDYIFSVIQQAVNSISDANTQQKVISYMQSKVTSMKASVNANNYKSRTLGRMSSKATKTKNKNF